MGPSDFYTTWKGDFMKRGPKIITYRDYSRFCSMDFRIHLSSTIAEELIDNEDYAAFDAVIMGVLNEHAPITKKYIRANDGPYTTKALREEHMLQTKLLKKYSRDRAEENFTAYKKQRKTCVNLLREGKYDYYRNINLANLSDNPKFWKTVKPLFSDKVQLNSSITLIEDGKMITKDSAIAEVFNNFFVNITENLGISTAESALLPIKNCSGSN